VKYGILGPLTMHDRGISCLPTAPKQQQLMSLFLLNANRFVSLDAAIDELWEDEPPRTVVPTLQTYVMQIRRSLASAPSVGSMAAARKILMTGNRGYFLMAPPGSLDLDDFNDAVGQGRDAQRRRDDAEVSRRLRSALKLWRGPVLGDVQAGPRLRGEIARIEEARLSVTEQCLEAELRLGYHHDVLSELSALASQHPLNENLQALYMLALYRSGRQVSALEVYRDLRRSVNDELGLEPSLQLRRLQQAILNADRGLDLDADNQYFSTMPRVGAR
jgi:SARP family transcriptional regulator, regulator of embCAB operon